MTMTQHTQKHNKNEIVRGTFRRPKLLNDLLEAKAKSTGNTAHKLMVDELWKSVEELRLDELKGRPSLETLHQHMAATLAQIQEYSKHAAKIDKMIAEEMAILLVKKKSLKKKSSAAQKK